MRKADNLPPLQACNGTDLPLYVCAYAYIFRKRIGEGSHSRSFRSLYNIIDIIVYECQACVKMAPVRNKRNIDVFELCPNHSSFSSLFQFFHFFQLYLTSILPNLASGLHNISHCSQRKRSHWIFREFSPSSPQILTKGILR